MHISQALMNHEHDSRCKVCYQEGLLIILSCM